MDALEALTKLIIDTKADYDKAKAGNKSARTRVRKAMQDIKAQAQAIRVGILGSDEEK